MSTFEKLIFATLIFIAGVLFFREAIKVIRIIKLGKPSPYRFDRFGKRLWRFIREVLLQRRVLSGRRLIVGLLHFGVFAGFVIFLFETTNMFLEPFGLAYLPAVFGSALPYFQRFMLVISIIVALCITSLTFRRFVLVKISPDPKSGKSAFVAFFILLLMLTYIDIYWTKLLPVKLDWWTHITIIATFPLLIIRSKHLHLILAPFNVFLRNFRLWEVEKLNLKFDNLDSTDAITFGLEKLRDISWKLRLDFFTCVECKRCTDNCPAAQAGMDLRPSEFITAGRKALMTEKYDDPVIGTIISETSLGQCTSCMACENVCPVGIEHSQLLWGVKIAQTLAIGTGGVATEFFKSVINYNNPYSARPEIRNALIEELNIPVYKKGETKYTLWLGCVWSYNPDFKKVVESTVKLLRQGGVSFGVLKQEKCSGHHSRRQGEETQFQMLAEENTAVIREEAVTHIITGCPHCYHTLKHEYSDFLQGHPIEVKHHSEFFAELICSGSLELDSSILSGGTATFHDPCYLGRYEGIFNPPRDIILSTGVILKEMRNSKKYSYCCGGGAAGFTIEHKGEKRVDQVRKLQVVAAGTKTLITACPECKLMLSGAVENTYDISEFLITAIKQSH